MAATQVDTTLYLKHQAAPRTCNRNAPYQLRSMHTVPALISAIPADMRTGCIPKCTGRSLPVVVAAVVAVLLVVLQDLLCCASTAVLQTHSDRVQVLQ